MILPYLEAFAYGFGIGIVLSSMLGTVFFALVQNSIENGVRSSLYISVGVIISDIILISVGFFNANIIPEGGIAEMGVRLVGGTFVVFLGLSSIYKRPKVEYGEVTISKKSPYYLGLKGFSLNFFNPGNFISWLAATALITNVYLFTIGQRIWFFIGALLAIFLMEVAIAFGALYLKKYLSGKVLHQINLLMGFVFLAFGIVLMWPLIKKLVGGW